MTLADNEKPNPGLNPNREQGILGQLSVGNWLQQLWLKTYKPGDKPQPTLFGHVLITSGVLTLILGSFLYLNGFANTKVKDWMVTTELQTLPNQSLSATAAEKARLEQQLKEIDSRIKRHADVMTFFYKQYYISISMASALGLVAGICVFFISKVGWKDANNGLINMFIVTSSAALFYGQLPAIFKQDTNLAANRNLYIEYITLKNEVLSYSATRGVMGINPENANSFTPVEPSIFISYVDQKMAKLNQIPIDFDITRVTEVPDFRQINPESGSRRTLPASPKP
ncbi:MAG: hypothetical protein AB1589_04525 [Cyanobacteriota bacterium]